MNGTRTGHSTDTYSRYSNTNSLLATLTSSLVPRKVGTVRFGAHLLQSWLFNVVTPAWIVSDTSNPSYTQHSQTLQSDTTAESQQSTSTDHAHIYSVALLINCRVQNSPFFSAKAIAASLESKETAKFDRGSELQMPISTQCVHM